MPERPIPASLIWLAALMTLSIVSALAAGGVLYWQTQQQLRTRAEAMTGGDVVAGRTAVSSYGCGSCHIIPGVSGATGQVGPDLRHVGQRAILAGSLSNDPATMVQWIQQPQQLRPSTGMPDMGVSSTDARNIAAYLYAQK